MLVYFETDDLYPVYAIEKANSQQNKGDTIEIDEELYEEYVKAMSAFHRVQNKLKTIIEKIS